MKVPSSADTERLSSVRCILHRRGGIASKSEKWCKAEGDYPRLSFITEDYPFLLITNHLSLILHKWPAMLNYALNSARADSEAARYSIPFFFNPTATAKMHVVPTCLQDGDAKYPPVLYLEG